MAVGVLASATDDIGVVGVQFKVDGALVGGEDIEAPYQALWNTVGATNGSHVLSAVARDAAGHETTTSVSVVVGNDRLAYHDDGPRECVLPRDSPG